jgi:hypothetical protein
VKALKPALKDQRRERHPPHRSLRAPELLALNLTTLLRLRRQRQKDLATWCGHSEVWISKILRCEREIQLKDLDRVAAFFGLLPYQLLQPGVSILSERRSGHDRRIRG